MADSQSNAGNESAVSPEEQLGAIKDFLSSINAARRQISMYGGDHPNSKSALAYVVQCTGELLATYQRATCVFTHEALIVNQHYYAPSRESVDMCERLRARGATAISFVGIPPVEQIQELVTFLNEEPREIRLQEGPSNYLRRRGVSRILLTESIYSAGETAQPVDESQWEEAGDDMVIAAVIDWLARQDEDEDPAPPKFPITRILSNPDSAAKLIREAVTKLHASRKDMSQGECVTEAINDLKSIASDTPDEWDQAAPQVRKAIAKLPEEMRPSSTGFTLKRADGYAAPEQSTTIEDVEILVHGILEDMAESHSTELPSPQVFDQLFGVKAPGLLTSWKKELQPTSVLESSGRTLDVLMNWETNACEHSRMAYALVALIPRAIEVGDSQEALAFAEWLLNGALQDTDLGWRRANVRGALESLEHDTLIALARTLIGMRRSRSEEAVIALLSLLPRLALDLIDVLGTREGESIAPALKQAIIDLGQDAQPVLAKVLRAGSDQAKRTAIEALIRTQRAWAAEEVINAFKGNNESYVLAALEFLPRIRVPMVTDTCMELLSHSSMAVRCAALRALGELGDATALPSMVKIATKVGMFSGNVDEQLAAVDALGRIGIPEAVESLKSIARRKPLIGRTQYDNVRNAASRLLTRLTDCAPTKTQKAA